MYDRVLSPQEIARNYNAMQIRTKSTDYVDLFTPTCSGDKGKVEVLVVGSGANGGADVGGGGAGAQVVHNSSFTVSSGVGIAVTVGNIRLGDQGGGNNAHGANGRDSAFSTISAMGGNGGRGRSAGGTNNNGYHGGGGSHDFAGNTSPSGGGNAGGDSAGRGTGSNGNGGGGGAGGVGQDGVSTVKAGDGAPGVVHDISGELAAYGAGGGGSYYDSNGYRGYGGSGVGVLLEIARNISENSPYVGIDIIFFDVEDQGTSDEQNPNPLSWCLGSQYWSTNLHEENYQARYGILLDMVGGPNAVFVPDYHSKYYASDVVNKVWTQGIEGGYLDYFEMNVGEDYSILDDHIVINEITKMLGRHIPTIDIIEYDLSLIHISEPTRPERVEVCGGWL